MTDSREEMSPQGRVARVFAAADHEVLQSVGAEPGAVDWFAIPRRALAVIMEGPLAPGYAPDLTGSVVNALTFRRLVLELSGLFDQVREHVAQYEASGKADLYLARRLRAPDGTVHEAVDYIDAWVQSRPQMSLGIVAPPHSGRSTVVEHARYTVGARFIQDPEGTTPLVVFDFLRTPRVIRESFEFAIYINKKGNPTPSGPALRTVENATHDYGYGIELADLILAELLDPEPASVDRWYQARLADPSRRDQLIAARRLSADFADFSSAPPNLTRLLRAALEATPNEAAATMNVSIARIVSAYMGELEANASRYKRKEIFRSLEDGALEQFALGRSQSMTDLARNADQVHDMLDATSSTWLRHSPPRAYDDRSAIDRLDRRATLTISNRLILHYFLARKIAREVQAGNLDILTRYQLPQEHVLLFLAILAPDVVAMATADRGEAMRVQIETEVERRLQFTLAHALKRSAGAVRSHIQTIRRQMGREVSEAAAYAFARVEAETGFQCALAKQTSLWHEVPESALEGLSLHDQLDPIVHELREAHAGKPQGTGMGLPIARRYAQHIGGQVGLEPDQERTCFFVRFVAWRELE